MDENTEKEVEIKQEQVEGEVLNADDETQTKSESSVTREEETAKDDDEVIEAKVVKNSDNENKFDLSIINILSLVFGIFSVLALFLTRGITTLVASVIAIILGYIGKNYPGNKMGRAGRICGIVSLIVIVVLMGIALLFFSTIINGLGRL